MDSTTYTDSPSNFLKCGDAIISRDYKMFAINCLYCKAIFLKLIEFINHILGVHFPELEINNIHDGHYIPEGCNVEEENEGIGDDNYEVIKVEEATNGASNHFDVHSVTNHQIGSFDLIMEPASSDSDSMTDCQKDVDDSTSVIACESSYFSPTPDIIDDTYIATTTDRNDESNEKNEGEIIVSADFINDEQLDSEIVHQDQPGEGSKSETTNNSNPMELIKIPDQLVVFDENTFLEQFKDYFCETDEQDCSTTRDEKCTEAENTEECNKRNMREKPIDQANEEQFLASLKDKCKYLPEIWDSSHPNFCNKRVRLMALKYLTKLMKMECSTINFNNIRLHVHKIRKDIEEEYKLSKHFKKLDDNNQAQNLSIPDFALIEFYEKENCLWSLEHPKFTDKTERSLAYLRITDKLNRIFYSNQRRKIKVKELCFRITQLCDWYKDQLHSMYRCKMLKQQFQVENELRFKQLEFLKSVFDSVVKKEEFTIREEMEFEYFKREDPFPEGDSDSDASAASSSEKINRNRKNETPERKMNSSKDKSLNVACTKQERIETGRIIETYRKFPILWNPQVPDSHSFKAKRVAMDEMAKILTQEYLMPMNGETVRLKLKNIRNQYKFHLKKLESGLKSNFWCATQLDEFLREHIRTSLRRVGRNNEITKNIPAPQKDLPFRFEANMYLNIDLIDTLRNSPGLWRNEDLTFQISTELLHDLSFHNMIQSLNTKHGMQLDENNMLMVLHDLFEWFKREMERYRYYNEQESLSGTEFVPSSIECWERMQFMADYKFLPDVYICATCNKTTKSLNAYLLDRGQHVSQQPFKCFYCDKRFLDITNCRTHECRIHRKIYNYSCNFCSRKFAHSTDAVVHRRRVHTQERLHVCEICGKAFVSSYEMKRHRKFHLRNTEYKCNVCNMEFTFKRQLNEHKKAEHRK